MTKTLKKVISVLLVVFLVSLLFFKYYKKDVSRESVSTNIQAEYIVKNGEFKEGNLKESSFKNKQKYEKIIQAIKNIFPNKYLNMVSKLEIFTDGKDNDLAYVTIDDNGKKWRVSIDINDTFDKKGELSKTFEKTIVHEMFHIISLNYEQMELYKTKINTLEVDEGKTKEFSYLNSFYNKFWVPIKEERKDVDENDIDSVETYYSFNKNNFVNSYAATNVVEDIAESFAYFVIDELPSGNNIKDQKIKFFYRYNELVEIRNNIRDVLDK